MTNAVDVIMVGGPAHKVMVCMSRDRMTTYVEFPTAGGLQYQISTREISDVWYRFGYPAGEDEPTDEAILAAGCQPAWDLRE